ncbi:hypothetical protein [Teredinibacter turnerae]|uniref:hypothetical protein n=1 Tax=Teredinibacter turnerae TaxID=2426 RepID=UPI0012BC0E95|nr:hypothetical protein [Teredinibacter turnerae]
MKSKPSELVGIWKSDAVRTLASMRQVEGISCKAKELFKNDFFGHLIAEYTSNQGRSYFDRDEDNAEGMKDFSPYLMLEETPEKFVIQYHDDLTDSEVTKELRREGNCYWLPVSKWEFREYFCRI